MTDKSDRLRATAAGLIAASALLGAQWAQAVPEAPNTWEKCAGVAKKGMNDCGALDGTHNCASQAAADNLPAEWVYTPEGTCAKIGGRVAKTKPAK